MTWSTPLFEVSYILLWVVVAVLLFVVLYLGRQMGVLYQRVGPAGALMSNPGPELNSTISQFAAEDIDGNHVEFGGLREKKTLIVFVSPGCASCADLADGLRAIARHDRDSMDVLLVSAGLDTITHQDFRKRHSLLALPYILSSDLRLTLKVTTAPYALLLDEKGALRSKGVVNSLNHLESMLNVIDSGFASVQDRQEGIRSEVLTSNS